MATPTCAGNIVYWTEPPFSENEGTTVCDGLNDGGGDGSACESWGLVCVYNTENGSCHLKYPVPQCSDMPLEYCELNGITEQRWEGCYLKYTDGIDEEVRSAVASSTHVIKEVRKEVLGIGYDVWLQVVLGMLAIGLVAWGGPLIFQRIVKRMK